MAAVHARMLTGAAVPIEEATAGVALVEAGSLMGPEAALSNSREQHLRAAKCNQVRSGRMF